VRRVARILRPMVLSSTSSTRTDWPEDISGVDPVESGGMIVVLEDRFLEFGDKGGESDVGKEDKAEGGVVGVDKEFIVELNVVKSPIELSGVIPTSPPSPSINSTGKVKVNITPLSPGEVTLIVPPIR
jgi:hypothetical protein